MSVKVSVILHNWNYGKWIAQTIESVINQDISHDNYEIIILDKNSTDNSMEIIKKYKEKYPNLIKTVSMLYTWQSKAINTVLKNNLSPSSDFICVLNSDDCFLPNHIKLHLEAMLKDSEIAVTHSDGMVCDVNMNYIYTFLTKKIDILLQSGENVIFQPSTMIRLSKLKEIGYFPENYKHPYDMACWSMMGKKGMKFHIVNDVTTKYRVHDTSMFRTFTKENQDEMARVKQEILKL